jgi:hypothetical protein
MGVMSGKNQTVWFVKPNSLVFPDRTELRKQGVRPSSFNRLSPPLSLSTKNLLGSLQEISTHPLHFLLRFIHFLHHFEVEK